MENQFSRHRPIRASLEHPEEEILGRTHLSFRSSHFDVGSAGHPKQLEQFDYRVKP
jgi:hypothetical protein